MKRLRLSIMGMMAWLILVCNVEHFYGNVNFANVVYVFISIVAVGVIFFNKVSHISFWGMTGGVIPLYVLSKVLLKYPVLGNALFFTILEISVIVLTIIFARWVGMGVSEFEQAIANILIGQPDLSVKSFVLGQSEMYRELNRARAHRRPLTVLSLGVDQTSKEMALDRMVLEAQSSMMREYMMSEVARVLCDKLEDYNIIARNHDHFVALLPEVTSEQVDLLSTQLRQIVSEQTGVNLHVGVASFPEDGATFEKLVNEAVAHMHARDTQQAEQSVQPKALKEKRLA